MVNERYKLSNQALGALMVALQKSLLEQTDIVPTLKGFDFYVCDDGDLMVENPPNVMVHNYEELTEDAEV